MESPDRVLEHLDNYKVRADETLPSESEAAEVYKEYEEALRAKRDKLQKNTEQTNTREDEFAIHLGMILSEIEEMLLSKNRKYGDSALNPIRVFSQVSKEEQIRVRIDDKISRLRSSQLDDDEDVINDLIGYLVLLKMSRAVDSGT